MNVREVVSYAKNSCDQVQASSSSDSGGGAATRVRPDTRPVELGRFYTQGSPVGIAIAIARCPRP